MIDIHTHVLPEMDDGAPDLETTAAMLDMAQADGITDIVATPHANLDYSFDPDRRTTNLQRAREIRPDGPTLYPGCEMHLTPDNIEALVRKSDTYTINGRNFVLLELPDIPAVPAVEYAVQIMRENGVRSIIAHPERNRRLLRDASFAEHLIRLGCYFQITGQSITGSFGPEVQKYTRSLFAQGMVHFVASDAHGTEHRRPLLSAAYQAVSLQYGEAESQRVFEENPRAVLQGESIRTAPAQRRTFFSSLFRRSRGSIPVAQMS